MSSSPPSATPWRSQMFVPANVPRFVEGASAHGADALILDLEDSVPPAEKAAAREAIPAAARACARDGADVLVRINRALEDSVADIRAAVIPGVAGLVVPKVHSAEHVALLDEVITGVEADRGLPGGHTSLMLLVETPDALRRVDHLPSGSPRVVAMSLGVHDLAAELDVAPDSELMLHAHQRLVIAALSAGIAPLGVVGAPPMADLAAYAAAVARARRLGYRGGTAVHPSQIPVLRHGFAPPPEEVDLAGRMVAAYELAVREGRGSVRVDGRMVDEPVARRARRTLRDASVPRRITDEGDAPS